MLLLRAASLLQRLASGPCSCSAWHAWCFMPLLRIQVCTSLYGKAVLDQIEALL